MPLNITGLVFCASFYILSFHPYNHFPGLVSYSHSVDEETEVKTG